MEIKICENIRSLRQERGVNQEALAEALSVSIQAVSKWETGVSLPDVVMIPKIAGYFGVTTDYLYFGGEQPPVQPDAPFPDDGVLRVVQYLGGTLLDKTVQHPDTPPIPLLIDRLLEQPGSHYTVEVFGDAAITGSVNGSLYADGDVQCQMVNGSATVSGDLTCERVNGVATGRGGSASVPPKRRGWSFSLNLGGLGAKRKWKDLELPFPDDGKLRVVQFIGSSPVTHTELDPDLPIPLEIELGSQTPLQVDIWGSAVIQGNINGSASAGDALTCENVGGNATAGDGINCGDVCGNVSAGDGVNCGNVGGSVTADDGVRCGDVGGSVKADGEVNCAEVRGNVTCDGNLTCGDVGGNVSCDGSMECGNINGDIKLCDGNIRCEVIKGNVRCDGDISYR